MDVYTEQAKEIRVYGHYDVIVVGGGPAGIAATIASARTGAKTLLIERFGFLGGTATASLMNNINGFRNQVKPDTVQTVKGIAQEIIIALHKIGGLGKSPYEQEEYDIEKGQLSYSYCIDPEKFKYVAFKLVDESNADVLLHTYFADVVVENNTIKGVIVENKSGRGVFWCDVCVDASGDGDVAARAGVPFWEAKNDDPRLDDGLMYKIGGIPDGCTFHGCKYGGAMVVWGPAMVWGKNDAWEISRAEIETRLEVYEHFRNIRKNNPDLAGENVFVAETPVLIGIRQTRFIEGEYKITADDAITGRRFEDVVAISSCPIIRYYGYRRYLDHEGYDIPYRALVPKKIDNLLVAGRCISSEQQPYESHRAMAPIMAIGEAAGTAAALCVKHGMCPRNMNIKILQETLITKGAELRLNLDGLVMK